MEDKLISKLENLANIDLTQALNLACIAVENEAKKNCPVDDGQLRQSITHEIEGNEAWVGTNVFYAPYVEYGTRFMEAQPYLKPAFDEQKEKFKKDMKKLVE